MNESNSHDIEPKEKVAKVEGRFPNCDYHKTEKLLFGSPSPNNKSTLTVSVKGMPCYEAVYSIFITDKVGRELYKYSESFKNHTAIQWDDPGLDAVAEELVEATGNRSRKTSDELPPYKSVNETQAIEEFVPEEISASKYEDYRKKRLPLFYHKTGYESGRWLVFDQTKSKAVILLVY